MRIRHLVCTGVVLVLTACGGGSSDGDSDEPPAKKTTSAKVALPPLTAADAKKALLRVDELSKGWKVDPDDDSEDDVKVIKGSKACKESVDDADDEAPTKVELSFALRDEAFLTNSIESYESTQAEKQWDVDLKGIKACHSFTLGDSDGFSIDLEVEPSPIADLGDDSAAFHASGEVQGTPVHFELMGVRSGRNVVGLTAVAFGQRAPRAELERMIETVLQRLDKLEDAA